MIAAEIGGRRCSVPGDGWRRDSASQRQAKKTLTAPGSAAIRPGAAGPNLWARDPILGPIITASAVAAESQPSASARRFGWTVSLTYAWATPVVPPPAP